MKLTAYSRNKILHTFATWRVPEDFAKPMYNYLIYGLSPGSCFTAILANDFMGAINHSHPANTIDALRSLSHWIADTLPDQVHGSYDKVRLWQDNNEAARRLILEQRKIIFTEKEEVCLVLKDTPTHEPLLY